MRKTSIVLASVTSAAAIAAAVSCSEETGSPPRADESPANPAPDQPSDCAGAPGGGCAPSEPPSQEASEAPAPPSASGSRAGEAPADPGGVTAPPSPESAPGEGEAGEGPSESAPAPSCDESTISTDTPSTLTVDLQAAAQVVHKEIFGVLMETLGRDVNGGLYVGTNSSIPNTNGLRNDIIQGFIDAGVGIVQWPGGCAANNYNWEQNVNPANTMGTDSFMEFCEAVGAEPYLTGRPNPAFAQSNREWVEYVNNNPEHPEWNLKYFKIGNEVWGCGGNLGHDNQALSTYETWYDANRALLREPVNGKALFLVGATAGIWTVNPNTDNWLTLMMAPQRLADVVDGIEIHDYLYFPEAAGSPVPNVGFSEAQYYDIVNRANQGQMAPRIADIRSILDEYDPEGRIKIMEDEWGDWLVGFNENQDTWLQQGTLMDAISASETLHVFMENADRVQMAALAQPINVIHSLFLTRPSDGVLVKTPTFYVFEMFRPHHTAGARWAPSELVSENIQAGNTSFPVLSAGVTVDEAGGVNVSLVNVDLQNARTLSVSLGGGTAPLTLSSARILTGPEKDSFNPFGEPELVNSQTLDPARFEFCGRTLRVELPAKSIVMFRLEPPPSP